MADITVKRTLVKSPPELWAELSEVESLSRHLGEFGEIRISRLDPEKTVAWEGEHASGTVAIAASSWGTKVVLTAEMAEGKVAPEAAVPPQPAAPEEEEAPVAEPAPEALPEPAPDACLEPAPEAFPEPEPAPDPEIEPEIDRSSAGHTAEPDPYLERAPSLQSEPGPDPEFEPAAHPRKRGFLARWLFRERGRAASAVSDLAEDDLAPPEGEPEPPLISPEPVEAENEPVFVEPEPREAPVAPEPEPEPEPEPIIAETDAPVTEEQLADTNTRTVIDHERALAVLEQTLDNLGSAHHRPFSRG